MNKRIKSYLIDAVSIFGTAFLAVTLTPEWANFTDFAHQTLVGLGVKEVVVVLLGKLISEIWKQILNEIAIRKAVREGVASSSEVIVRSLDLY